MGKQPEKKLGVTGNCYRCNGLITCGEGYEKKPTWKNSDGKSHYNKDGTCRNGIGVVETSSVLPPATTKINWPKIEEKSDDMKQLVMGLESMIFLAWENTKKTHPDLDENSNIFGQIVNAKTTHLIQLAKVKAIKEVKI